MGAMHSSSLNAALGVGMVTNNTMPFPFTQRDLGMALGLIRGPHHKTLQS